MMNGIDISHWQKGIALSKLKCDFVIVKATEGVNILDSYFAQFMRESESLGKCLGFYHFAHPEKNTAKAEAKYFYNNTTKYFGKGIPVLDWESSGKSNVTWAKEWLDEIYMLTGVKPMIYMSEAVANAYDWSKVANADYGLWVAKYRDNTPDKNYDMSRAGNKPSVKHWKTIAMWQWTSCGRLDGYSANLDCDLFYGDKNAWSAYAGKATNKATTTATTTASTTSTVQTYKVHTGDTLSSIAKKFNTTVDALVKKNNIKDKNKIYVGQTLKI